MPEKMVTHTKKLLSIWLARLRAAQLESAAKPPTHDPTCGCAPGYKHLEPTQAGSRDFNYLIYLDKYKNKATFYLAIQKNPIISNALYCWLSLRCHASQLIL